MITDTHTLLRSDDEVATMPGEFTCQTRDDCCCSTVKSRHTRAMDL